MVGAWHRIHRSPLKSIMFVQLNQHPNHPKQTENLPQEQILDPEDLEGPLE